MDIHVPFLGVIETVVTDDDLTKGDVSTHASRGKDVPTLSKQVMKAYSKAMKAGKTQDAKARRTCAMLRAKRDGTDPPVDLVIREEPVAKVQMLLSDF